MFGPIRITHAGQSFYTNLVLGEHHRFTRGGRSYVFDVQAMAVHELPQGLDDLIGRLRVNRGSLVDERSMTALRELGLVTNEHLEESGAPDAASPAARPAPSRRQPVTRIALFVAQKCNMKCTYCYGEGGEYSEAGLMESETAFAGVDWLIENSFTEPNIEIGFFGGEPLLNFKLMQQVTGYARERARAAGKRITFSLTTNGTLVTETILDFLVSEGINPMISYDGPADYQDRQRPLVSGEGSYARVRANVEKLKSVFPHLRGRATLYGDGDPFEVQKAMEEVGFSTSIVAKASPVLARCEHPPEPSPAETAKSDRMIAFTRYKIERVVESIKQRTLPDDNPPSILADLKRMATREKKLHACGAGKDVAGVSASGDIYPCHRFVGLPDMRIGHIGEYRAGDRTSYHRATVDTSPVCAACWGRYLCGGGCMYENKAATGDLHLPNQADCREKLAGFEEIAHVYTLLDSDDWTYIDGVIERANRRVPQEAARPEGTWVRSMAADLVQITGVR